MKKVILIFNFLAFIIGLNAQDHTNDTQATILKTGNYTVTIYAKPMSNIVNAPDINLNFAVSLPGASGPGPSTATSLIGGTLTAAPVEVFGTRRCYPYTLSSSSINMTGGIDNPIATVTFPSTIGTQILAQLNDYTASGAQQAFWYISHSGGDQTPYASLFYGTNATNVEGGDSHVDLNAPLPISLVSFKAQKYQERSSFLTWSTVSEINSSHFLVQRSTDKKAWTTVGKVNAAGNSQLVENYEFIDQNVYNGIDSRLSVYYRLQMVDLDGQQKNSPIENVIFGNDAGKSSDLSLLIYPNPASDGVNVTWDAQSTIEPTLLELYDVTGKLVLTQKVSDNANQEYIDFGPAKIDAGVYLLRILNGTEPIEHQQIVVGHSK